MQVTYRLSSLYKKNYMYILQYGNKFSCRFSAHLVIDLAPFFLFPSSFFFLLSSGIKCIYTGEITSMYVYADEWAVSHGYSLNIIWGERLRWQARTSDELKLIVLMKIDHSKYWCRLLCSLVFLLFLLLLLLYFFFLFSCLMSIICSSHAHNISSWEVLGSNIVPGFTLLH